MVESFNDNVENAEDGLKSAVRALQAWQYLIGKASNRQTIRYNELMNLMDYAIPNPMTPALGCIMFYCMQHNIPPLTIIVVTGDGIPGEGFTAVPLERYPSEREKVFEYQWYKIMPPTVKDFRKAYVAGRE